MNFIKPVIQLGVAGFSMPLSTTFNESRPRRAGRQDPMALRTAKARERRTFRQRAAEIRQAEELTGSTEDAQRDPDLPRCCQEAAGGVCPQHLDYPDRPVTRSRGRVYGQWAVEQRYRGWYERPAQQRS